MEKLKDFFNRLTSNYKTYVKQYMATNIVIIIATLVFTFANFNVWSKFLTSFAIIAVIVYKLFIKDTGKVKLPGGYSFERK